MLDNDNIWKDRFNETSLNNEEWLEPNPEVLDNIMHAVEPRKKRPLILWILFGLALLLLILMGSMNFMSAKAENTSVQEEVKQHAEQRFDERQKTIAKEKIDASTDKVAEEISNSNTQNTSINDKAIASNSNASVKTYNRTRNGLKPKVQEDLESLKEQSVSNDATAASEQISHMGTATAQDHIEGFEQIKDIDELQRIAGQLVWLAETPEVDMALSPVSIEKEAFEPIAVLSVGGGFGLWNFNLNSNYQTALDPADFYHDRGESVGLNIEYEKSLGSRLAVVFSAAYSEMTLNSGHNSSINYDPNNEDANQDNHFNLTMASPIGFMQSDVVINRRSSSTQANDIVVDLHNRHDIRSIDLGVAMRYKLFASKTFELNTDIGIGINRLIKSTNVLEYCGVDNPEYVYSSGMVTSEPENIQKTSLVSDLGIMARYALGNDFFIQSGVHYKSHFTPIYKENDFSTRVNRIQIALQFAKKF